MLRCTAVVLKVAPLSVKCMSQINTRLGIAILTHTKLSSNLAVYWSSTAVHFVYCARLSFLLPCKLTHLWISNWRVCVCKPTALRDGEDDIIDKSRVGCLWPLNCRGNIYMWAWVYVTKRNRFGGGSGSLLFCFSSKGKFSHSSPNSKLNMATQTRAQRGRFSVVCVFLPHWLWSSESTSCYLINNLEMHFSSACRFDTIDRCHNTDWQWS